MLPDRWDRVQSVFIGVADEPLAERPSLLDAACGDDRELRAEVELLLAADSKGTAAAISEVRRAPPVSLYERLGGIAAIRAVVEDLVGGILADNRVNRWFAHAAPSGHRRSL